MVSLARYTTYELLSQKAIKLLIEALKNDFGIEIVCGAELEFYWQPAKDANESVLSSININSNQTRLQNYAAYHTKAKNLRSLNGVEMFESEDEAITGSSFLDQSRYISHLYKESGSLEAVFTHLGMTNPLRLAGAVETFKKKLVQNDGIAGKSEINLSPSYKRSVRSLQINVSSTPENVYSIPFFSGNMAPTLFECLYLGYNNHEAAERFFVKYGKSINSEQLAFHKDKSERETIEFKLFAPNCNAYLALATVLTTLYDAMDRTRKGIISNSTEMRIPTENHAELIEHFRTRFANNTNFRGVLDKLSGHEKLGSALTASCLAAENLLTPIGNSSILLR